jgi:ketosteroid isomerase-like protein
MTPVAIGTGLTVADVAAIRSIREPWTKACLQRDWDFLLTLCTSDVTFLPPNESAAQGTSVRPWLDTFPTIKTMDWDIDHVEGSSDLAWLRGWVRMSLEHSGQEIKFNGKYTDVCRKEADGVWRMALVIWNSNEPIE